MINLSIEPNSTQFSVKNAYALALASKLAYDSEENIKNKLQEQGFSCEFINEPSTDIPSSLLLITAQPLSSLFAVRKSLKIGLPMPVLTFTIRRMGACIKALTEP
jgi:hypothetical protein